MSKQISIPKWARQVAQQINENVSAVDSGRITWPEFSDRQRAAWDSVSRGEMNIIGSACYRRMQSVMAAFKVAA